MQYGKTVARSRASGLARGLVAALAAVVLASCGGGGDGGGGADTGFTVIVDRSSVEWTFGSGEAVAPAVLQVTSRGTPPATFFVDRTTPTGAADPNIALVEAEVDGATRSAVVRVHPTTTLAPGDYRGTVVLRACADAACAQQFPGSPFNLAYTIHVTPGLQVQDTLVLEGDMGSDVAGTVAVALPPGLTNYTATPLSPRLTVDAVAADGFRVTANSTVAGVFEESIEVRAGDFTALVTVHYVARPVTLRLDRTTLAFGLVSGTTASADLQVTQLPLGATTFTAVDDATPWLRVSQGGGGRITATVLPMPSGSYTGSLSVDSAGVVVTVPVSYVVTPPEGGDRTLSTTLSAIAFAAPQGMVPAAQVLGLVRPSWNSTVDVAVAYESGAGWLQYTTRPDGNLEFTASAVGLPAGTLRATVTLTGAYPAPVLTIPVTFTVGAGLNTPLPQFINLTPASPATLTGGNLVTADGASTLTWTATAVGCDSWLHLTRSSGVLGTAYEYTVDVAPLRALLASTDRVTCTIGISVQGPALPPGSVSIAPTTAVIVASTAP